MTIIMVLPLILTSCGDDKTAEEIANENFQEADKALTLSVWLPAPKVDSNFEAHLDAVEAAINDILRSGNYCTELEFHVFSEDTYYDELTAKFASIKETEKTNGMANITANKYVNHAVKNPETGIYEMAYPDVLNTQLDIFFVGGYSNYYSYIASGDTYALNEFFTEGQVFNGLFKRIRNVFMSAMIVDGKYHAIPNNHVYAENGQYVLVNKDLFDSNANVAWNDSFGLYDLKEYIESIGALNLENVVPFVGTTEDIPGVVYLDKESLIAGSIANGTVDANGNLSCEPDFLYNLNEYVDYISFYKELSEKSYVSNSLADGEKAAVRIVNGTSLSLAEYADDYYMIETVPAYADIETMYSSMFAISSHSADYKRAMQILYLFQDNTEIRTLLQYGIKDVDYTVAGAGDEAIVNKNDTGYDMNLLYTGNCYRTYPDNGMPLEYWDSVKDFNLLYLVIRT